LIRVIAKRYAGALAALSEEKKTVDKTQADLAAFVEAVEAQPAMQRLFASPVFTRRP
jgi:F0F1-type ATP synthase delta subunit